MVRGLLEWEGELVCGSRFVWEMRWKIGLWWCMMKQMGDGTTRFDET
jgi:hypothetical protein